MIGLIKLIHNPLNSDTSPFSRTGENSNTGRKEEMPQGEQEINALMNNKIYQ